MKALNQRPVWMVALLLNTYCICQADFNDIYYNRHTVHDEVYALTADGVTNTKLFDTGTLGGLNAIGYDANQNFLFRVEGGSLIRTDRNGNNATTVFNFEGSQDAEDILLIPSLGKIVYAQDNGLSADEQIGMLDYDGSNHMVLTESSPGLGLAYDSVNEDLYYTLNRSTLNIRKIKLDGTGDTLVVSSGSHVPAETLALADNTLYFGGDGIYSVSTGGGAITQRSTIAANRLSYDWVNDTIIYHDDTANVVGRMLLTDYSTSTLLSGVTDIADLEVGVIPEPHEYLTLTGLLLLGAASLRRHDAKQTTHAEASWT